MISGSTHAVIFDLDGTLIDSFPGIAEAYHHVLLQMGLPAFGDTEIRQLIGPPIQEALQDHFGLRDGLLDEGVRIFREHYGTQGLFRYTKYRGVESMLSSLREQGFDLYIATSKLRSMALDIIENAGWTDFFRAVGGAEPDGSRRLKKDVIEWTLTKVTEGANVVAMVGDRADDIACGRELGLRGIGVSWGYGSVKELNDAGAVFTANSPNQLLSTLGQFK